MKKNIREVKALVELINEYVQLENMIKALPVGYISNKTIAGHTYSYRQWREKDKIFSSYVPEALLNGVKRKIAIRKENENALKLVKKDLKKVSAKVIKAGTLTQEDVDALLKAGLEGQDVFALADTLVK